MKLCWGILPLIAVLLTCVAQAQCVDTRHFTNADGLPENTPFAMLQDRRGNLWVGTRSGACWYDGHQFHALPPGQFATDQNVTALAEAPDGTLWFGHAYGGLSWLRRGQGRAFLPHGYDPPNLVQTLFCNDNTTLWVGSDRGLFRCHFAASDTTITRPTLVASQPEAAVNALCQGPPGQLLVATEAGLAVVEQASGRVVAAQLPPMLTRNPCSFVSRVNDTLFWVCGPNIGLVRLSYRRGAGTWAAQSYRKAQGLCANNVLNALQDRAGRVWALTPAGLSRIDVDGRVSCFLDDKQLQLTDFPNVLLEDREGNLWSGHGAGGLHQRLGDERLRYFAADDQSARSTSLPLIAAATGLPKGEITAVMEIEPGTFWLGSLRGVYVFRPAAPAGQQATALASTLPATNSRERANHYVFSLYRDAQGQLWQGSANGLARYSFTTRRWQTFDDVPGLLHELVLSIVPDRRGRLWLATLSKGVTVYDPATRRFHTLSETESGGPGTLDCWKLHRDALGDIWLGTEGNGLLRLDQTRDVFAPVPGSAKCTGLREMADDGHGGLWLVSYHTGLHHFDGRHITAVNYQRGLPPASVTSVATDRAGQLWLGTSQGLDGYDPRSGRVVRYGVGEGFFGHGASPGSIAFDRAGQLWVGTQQGLMCYDPRQVHPNTVPPVTNLTGVRLFLKGVAVRPGVSLAYQLNHLTFDYIGVSLTNPDQVRYRYRLRGLDDEQWVGPLVANSATYTNLPPGDYTFEVKAANNEGVWNEKPAAFAFTIRPPWWRSWWAYGLYMMGAGLAVLGLRNYIIGQERLRSDLRLERAALGHLQELDKVKTNFFTNISHEFRTPLTLILGPAQDLAQDGPDPVTRRKSGLILRNAQRLLGLINQLLDLSKLDAGAMELLPTAGNLAALAQQVAATFAAMAEARNIRFSATGPAELPWVFDAAKLEIILNNLLSNALRYTPAKGAVLLTWRMVPDTAETPAQVEIMVGDTGPGIAAGQLPRLFDRFYQGDHPTTPGAQPGTGVGLALVRELTALHGGTVAVSSPPGQGATFTVYLPVGLRPVLGGKDLGEYGLIDGSAGQATQPVS